MLTELDQRNAAMLLQDLDNLEIDRVGLDRLET